MKPVRPIEHIRRDLATAGAYRERYLARPSGDPLALMMREANEQEIRVLESELKQATAGELELTLLGPAYESHQVGIPLLTRILGNLQSTFRAVYRSRTPSGSVHREEATLSLVATAPGSFKVVVATPPAQLDLLEPAPLADQAIGEIIRLFVAAEEGQAGAVAPAWAAAQDEPVLKAMIRLSAALAVAQGSTMVRWHGVNTPEQLVRLRKEDAKDLVLALAGQPGREVVQVTGHLELGQDRPPRIRLRTAEDEYSAKVPTELLDRVKELLFGEVQATLIIDMKTSPTTGSPDTDIELIDLSEA
ncbi:MAG TPA: hypothetical protein VME46_05665 [Acidimicrobiales bacterium]|nr:hypothetical protein [Acidimicrobiales bacterium]